ncbi:hypothetical protein JTB14_022717 [Gonioctena quinquepunctata]|nr:hypothetical protein JTB14_022717 [Gonioctena quinquepunctata]
MQIGINIKKKKSNTHRRKHSDTDDEDAEEAGSEIGEDSDSGEELDRPNNEIVRPGGGSEIQMMNSSGNSQSIVDTNHQSTNQKQN